MAIDEYKLDNPIWYSLCEAHNAFSLRLGTTLFYSPEYCLFGEQLESTDTTESIDAYSQLSSHLFIIGERPTIPDGFSIKQQVDCLQMVIDKRVDTPAIDHIIKLSEVHLEDVLTLVAVAYPNFFQPKTFFLGNNFGIFINGQLVAMTGERMKMHQFTEISSVITHPEHTGKGYAKQLLTHTVNSIFSQNKQPYLHVAKPNTSAIALYKKLGFRARREITFWGIEKHSTAKEV